MSLKLIADLEALASRVKALEAASVAKAESVAVNIEHATKDDIDALIGRIRALEAKLERKGK